MSRTIKLLGGWTTATHKINYECRKPTPYVFQVVGYQQ